MSSSSEAVGRVAALGAGLRQGTQRQLKRAGYVGAVLRSCFEYDGAEIYYGLRMTVRQVRFTAVDALPLSLFLALLIGCTIMLQAYSQSARLGVSAPAQLLATIVVRELGPLLAAIIVLGRSGTAIAAELAGSRVFGEADALEALGVNPVQLFALPRVAGAALSVVILTVHVDAVAMLSGLLSARILSNVALGESVRVLRDVLSATDLAVTIGKAAIFGAGIGLLCSYEGLFAAANVNDLPRAVTRGVVSSLVFIFLASALLTALVYR